MPFANVNDTELYYEIKGEGEPLLLIPGLGLDHKYYRLGEPLLSSNCQTILVDPRGIGQSRKDQVEYTAELWADDYAALLDHLKIEKAHVLGSSLGGTVALAMGVRHPNKVASLIIAGGFSELTRSVEMNYALRKKMIPKLGMGEEMAEFMGLWIMTREFIDSDEGQLVLEASKKNVQQNPADLYIKFLDSILRLGRRVPGGEVPLLTQQIKAIKCPTLVMCADNDHFIPSSLSHVIADNIEGSEYVEIKNGGHIPFIEKPIESARCVLDFINKLTK
jgi:pimeloyl-ACP methyl ester carboxylesterase